MDRNVRLLGLGAGVRLFGAAMVYPYLSLYLKNVAGVGYAEIGALILLVSIIPLSVTPFGGLIADRMGRRRIFLLALAGEAAAFVLIASSMLTDSIPGVLLGGGLAGVAGAAAEPAISAYVADLSALSERAAAYTWVRIGFNGGFTLGVALGGSLIGFLGFPDTGFLAAGILAGSTTFFFLALDPSPYDLKIAKGAVPKAELAAPRPGSLRESVRTLSRDRTFLVLCVSGLLSGTVYGNWSTTFPLFSNTILHVSYGVLGVALALNGAIVVFGQTPMTRLMKGKRYTTSAVLATLLMALSFVVLGGVSLVAGAAVAAVFAFVAILTVGENLGALPSMTLPSNMAPATEIGSYNGAFGLFSGVGNSLAPAMGGLVLAYVLNPLAVWALLAIPCVPAVVLFVWLGGRISKPANTV